MRNIFKSICSFITLGLFLFFAFASELLDESTNTTVAIHDCEERPPFTGMVHIDVLFTLNGAPHSGATGTLFLIHQKVKPDTTCSYIVLANQKLPFTTDAGGHFVYDGVQFTHDNSEDLYRIEVEYNVPFSIFGNRKPRETQAKKYNDANFQFNMDHLTDL